MHMPRAVAFVACLVALSGPVYAARYAVCVGIDHYWPYYGPSELPSCVNDANGFRTALAAHTALWPSANLTVLTDSSATKTAIRSRLNSLASTAVSGDVVVYFHSSHGGRHSGLDAFICTYNASYEDYELAADLARFASGVTVIVVIDACYSGGLYQLTGGAVPSWDFAANVMSELDGIRKAAGVTKGASVGWITACAYDQTAWAGSVYSLFTEYALGAFTHGDGDGNGVVTFLEIFNYSGALASAVNPDQTAQTYNAGVLAATVARGDVTIGLPDALDATALSWTSGGSQAWRGQVLTTHDGVDAGRSGIPGGGQSSWVQTTVTGPGIVSFWWKVSSESGHDYLRFAIDGVEQAGSISGEVNWQQKELSVAAGTHTLSWTYAKDFSGASGDDAGWLDQVVYSHISSWSMPVSFPNRWAALKVWDATGNRWTVSQDSFSPLRLTAGSLKAAQWYWIGVWDYSAAMWVYGEWFCWIE
jgi:hypothetical protein